MGFLPSKFVPDSEYLLRRTTLKAEMARGACTERAAAAHHRIAGCYLAKLFGGQSASPPDAEGDAIFGGTETTAIGITRIRFSDVTCVPESEDLNRVLHSIL